MRSSTSRWAAMLQVVPRRRLRITVERVVLELGLCACFCSTVDCTVRGARGPRAGAAHMTHRMRQITSLITQGGLSLW